MEDGGLTGTWRDFQRVSRLAMHPRKVWLMFCMLVLQVVGSLALLIAFSGGGSSHWSGLAEAGPSAAWRLARAWAGTAPWWQWGLLVGWNYLSGCYFLARTYRVAAVEWTRGRRITPPEEAEFLRRRAVSFLCAPVPVLCPILLSYGLVALGGTLARIPNVGGFLVAILFPLGLLVALPCLYFGVLFVVGLPAIWAAIVTESCETITATSIVGSYLYEKFWRFLVYHVVGLFYALRFHVLVVAGGVILLAATVTAGWKGLGVLGAGSSGDHLVQVLHEQGMAPAWLVQGGSDASLASSGHVPTAARLAGQVFAAMVHLYLLVLVSLCLSTLIVAQEGVYLMIRYRSDGEPMDHLDGETTKSPGTAAPAPEDAAGEPAAGRESPDASSPGAAHA